MLVIFDLDGTLVDNRQRLAPLGLTPKQFSQGIIPAETSAQKVEDTYLNPDRMLQDPSYLLVALKLHYYLNLRRLGKHPRYQRMKIGVLSNRPETLVETSKAWLLKQGINLADLDFLVHRPADMKYDRQVCLNWKVEQVMNLRTRFGLTTLAVYDDDMAVLENLKDTDSERYYVTEGIISPLEGVAKR